MVSPSTSPATPPEDMPSRPHASHITAYRPFPSFVEWSKTGIDSSIYDRTEERLINKREAYGEETLRLAVERASRSAAVDTGAIEGLYTVDRGFTYTVATQAATWEALVEHKGDSARRAIEDAINAYDYVLDAATQQSIVSEIWIRELHSIICANQDTYEVIAGGARQNRLLEKGAYKTLPNSPWNPSTGTIHEYAPVLDTRPEMHRLIEELRSTQFAEAHPVLQASYAHYAYVCIHPFPDGNGRVARALASAYLYRNPGIPLVIFADQRARYFEALEAADDGKYEVFINFVETCVVDTMGVITAQMRSPVPDLSSSLADVEKHFASISSERVYFDAAERLAKVIQSEFKRQIHGLVLPDQVSFQTIGTGATAPRIPGYRPAEKAANFRVTLESSAPAPASVSTVVCVLIGTLETAKTLAVVGDDPEDMCEVSLREIEPTATETLNLKATGWVEGQIARYFSELSSKMRDS